MVAENIRHIRTRIQEACTAAGRSADAVTLIAVTKTFGPELVKEAIAAGVHDIGENYVQELLGKREHVSNPEIRWHYIGHLQSNKVKYLAEWIHLIHSVDSLGLASEIQKRAEKVGRTVGVLVEVNTSDESSKFGVKPEKALGLLAGVAVFRNIRLEGVMTIGPFEPDPEASRPAFKMLKTIFDEANTLPSIPAPLRHLSMGMTHDFEVAIQEGATMVRIGTAIFGTRKKPGASL
ncbi:MAG: YggS family pyridoxal phosphate-dependent enzyme [Ignavibacteriales bacterium]|nr:YggS family pyridoxal phosphate-dependent enzyme [Ignavibacteriales bacterium]